MMRLFSLSLAALLWCAASGVVLADDTAANDAEPAGAEAVHADEQPADDEHAHEDHAGGHATEQSGPNPIEVDPDLAWFTLVVFVCLAVLLRLVAWDPILKALQAREAGITANIDAAAAKHEEAKALLAEHEAKIASATDEVKAMLDEARRDAEQTKSQIIAEARTAAEAEKQRAVREVDQARDAAVKHLAEESANLAIDLAARVVKSDISPERQGEIVNEAIGRLAASEPSEN